MKKKNTKNKKFIQYRTRSTGSHHVQLQRHVLREMRSEDRMARRRVVEDDAKQSAGIARKVLQMQMQQIHVRFDVFLQKRNEKMVRATTLVGVGKIITRA